MPVHYATTTNPEVVARGGTMSTPPPVYATRAVLYLRVSTLGQAHTDRDGEGFSIAAQRDACSLNLDNSSNF